MTQLNSNFVDLMEIDMAEIRKKIQNDFLHIEKLNNSDLENKQSSVSKKYTGSKPPVKHSEILKIL